MSSGGNNSNQSNKVHSSSYGPEGLPGPNYKGSIFGHSSEHFDKIYGKSLSGGNSGGSGSTGGTNNSSGSNSNNNNSGTSNSGDKK
ncbi:uncharacterized protein PgNI_01927 [Pyricularia grisea]|uniref:Uncharacterized protein n=1 Tax=Pyricularia grisea TaxID=148305 RepID=A0A6P8BHA1_PYRGI|nr:uncharacterized protein PgNI_01927 [Pyricularia grisea]TLD16095.1 hypothetical protein PgNI_01927 [Pyricularia grisea]